jgi:hypothetical protein
MIQKTIFFVNILTFVSIKTETIRNDFKVFKNQVLNITVGESSLTSSVYKPLWMDCATICSTNPNC